MSRYAGTRSGAMLLVLALAVLVLAGCGTGLVVGSGKSTTEERQVSGFDRVELSFVGELNITQGDEEKLVITADDNIMPLITTEVSNGTLEIGSKSSIGVPTSSPIRFDLTVKNLRELQLSGAGAANVGKLKTDTLATRLSGAGSVKLTDLAADTLQAMLSGTGSLEASGKVNKLTVVLSGLGGFNGKELQSSAAKVTISGLGGAEVAASESLDATVSGAGGVTYYGNPQVTKTVSGLGNVTQGD